jgi:hypothetical protein
MVGVDNPFADKNTVDLVNEAEQKAKQKKSDQQNYNVKQSKIADRLRWTEWKRIFKRHPNPGRLCPGTAYRFYFHVSRGELRLLG